METVMAQSSAPHGAVLAGRAKRIKNACMYTASFATMTLPSFRKARRGCDNTIGPQEHGWMWYRSNTVFLD